MVGLIPRPVSMVANGRKIVLDSSWRLNVGAAMESEASLLAEGLLVETGWRPGREGDGPAINLKLDSGIKRPEEYRLEINPAGIFLTGSTAAGVFRGCQTLIQIVAGSQRLSPGQVRLDGVVIEDYPRFSWRGMMMDVSRHFFTADQVCRMLDLLALHKFNVFHWHLTDDQGWRFPVKKYPFLTQIGGFRSATLVGHYNRRPRQYDQRPYGGFYSPEDIRRVVAHAARRHINIVPEIDMPGHMQAAIAAYPELGNLPMKMDVRCHWGISQHILNPKKETIDFMRDVLAELMEYFPGRFVHIGGDEAVKHEWSESRQAQDRMRELGLANEDAMQAWYIGQMASFLAEHGRRIIGWDEILEGDALPANAAVMSWRGTAGGIKAATQGHDVVMTPNSHTYFDFYQADPATQPLAIGGNTTLEKAYGYDPLPAELPVEFHDRVMGSQCQLWAEYIPTFDHLQYMAFPRACALAEGLWTPADQKSWPDFRLRIQPHMQRLASSGLKHGPLPA